MKRDVVRLMAAAIRTPKWPRKVEEQVWVTGITAAEDALRQCDMPTTQFHGFKFHVRQYLYREEFFLVPSEMVPVLDAVADWVSNDCAKRVLYDLLDKAVEE